MKNVNNYKLIQQQPEFALIGRKLRRPKKAPKQVSSGNSPPLSSSFGRLVAVSGRIYGQTQQRPPKRPGNSLKTARKFAANTCAHVFVFVYFSPLRLRLHHLIAINRRAPPAPLTSTGEGENYQPSATTTSTTFVCVCQLIRKNELAATVFQTAIANLITF